MEQPTISVIEPLKNAPRPPIFTPLILHLLGLRHQDLTYHHNGRDERLTDVYNAKVINEILA